MLDKFASPWDNYEQINDIDDKIKENLTKLANEQLQSLKDGLSLLFVFVFFLSKYKCLKVPQKYGCLYSCFKLPKRS